MTEVPTQSFAVKLNKNFNGTLQLAALMPANEVGSRSSNDGEYLQLQWIPSTPTGSSSSSTVSLRVSTDVKDLLLSKKAPCNVMRLNLTATGMTSIQEQQRQQEKLNSEKAAGDEKCSSSSSMKKHEEQKEEFLVLEFQSEKERKIVADKLLEFRNAAVKSEITKEWGKSLKKDEDEDERVGKGGKIKKEDQQYGSVKLEQGGNMPTLQDHYGLKNVNMTNSKGSKFSTASDVGREWVQYDTELRQIFTALVDTGLITPAEFHALYAEERSEMQSSPENQSRGVNSVSDVIDDLIDPVTHQLRPLTEQRISDFFHQLPFFAKIYQLRVKTKADEIVFWDAVYRKILFFSRTFLDSYSEENFARGGGIQVQRKQGDYSTTLEEGETKRSKKEGEEKKSVPGAAAAVVKKMEESDIDALLRFSNVEELVAADGSSVLESTTTTTSSVGTMSNIKKLHGEAPPAPLLRAIHQWNARSTAVLQTVELAQKLQKREEEMEEIHNPPEGDFLTQKAKNRKKTSSSSKTKKQEVEEEQKRRRLMEHSRLSDLEALPGENERKSQKMLLGGEKGRVIPHTLMHPLDAASDSSLLLHHGKGLLSAIHTLQQNRNEPLTKFAAPQSSGGSGKTQNVHDAKTTKADLCFGDMNEPTTTTSPSLQQQRISFQTLLGRSAANIKIHSFQEFLDTRTQRTLYDLIRCFWRVVEAAKNRTSSASCDQKKQAQSKEEERDCEHHAKRLAALHHHILETFSEVKAQFHKNNNKKDERERRGDAIFVGKKTGMKQEEEEADERKDHAMKQDCVLALFASCLGKIDEYFTTLSSSPPLLSITTDDDDDDVQNPLPKKLKLKISSSREERKRDSTIEVKNEIEEVEEEDSSPKRKRKRLE